MDIVLECFVGVLRSEAFFTLLTALIGALVGGWFTRNATLKAHRLSTTSAQIENHTNTKNSLTLIKAELKAAWSIYNQEYVPDLLELPDGDPYLVAWAVGKDSFVIFDTMSQCLSEISTDVSEMVVTVYMRLKGVVAMVEQNNEYTGLASGVGITRHDEILAPFIGSGKEVSGEELKKHQEYLEKYIKWQAIRIGMGEHADALKKLTQELVVDVEAVFEGLDVEISKFDEKVARLRSSLE
ncbi:hypothetical protein I5I82_08335 [Pseudomonas aeruginosa]|nr:hypothetical protein [Pseudomonas aeruginosa]